MGLRPVNSPCNEWSHTQMASDFSSVFWYLNIYLLPISNFALFYTIYVFRVDVRIGAMDAKAPIDF